MKTLIKILCLSVLWFSCESIFHNHDDDPDGICVKVVDSNIIELVYCQEYEDEFSCLMKEIDNSEDGSYTWDWYENITCEEFCELVPGDWAGDCD